MMVTAMLSGIFRACVLGASKDIAQPIYHRQIEQSILRLQSSKWHLACSSRAFSMTNELIKRPSGPLLPSREAHASPRGGVG
jgi:hypothetical protein